MQRENEMNSMLLEYILIQAIWILSANLNFNDDLIQIYPGQILYYIHLQLMAQLELNRRALCQQESWFLWNCLKLT